LAQLDSIQPVASIDTRVLFWHIRISKKKVPVFRRKSYFKQIPW
jgi:hypothetical protein